MSIEDQTGLRTCSLLGRLYLPGRPRANKVKSEANNSSESLDWPPMNLSVSNSSSGRHWELDQVPAVGDPTHIVQIGRDHRVPTAEGQRRVALQ